MMGPLLTTIFPTVGIPRYYYNGMQWKIGVTAWTTLRLRAFIGSLICDFCWKWNFLEALSCQLSAKTTTADSIDVFKPPFTHRLLTHPLDFKMIPHLALLGLPWTPISCSGKPSFLALTIPPGKEAPSNSCWSFPRTTPTRHRRCGS